VTTYFVPQPEGLTWTEWASGFIVANPTVFDLPRPTEDTDWYLWAEHLRTMPLFTGYTIGAPLPDEPWQLWVETLAGALVAGT
jgi:hypothetical protein